MNEEETVDMYLLDYKIPKRLEAPAKNLHKLWLESGHIQPTTKQQNTKSYQAVSCFVYNAEYNLARNRKLMDIALKTEIYSRPLIYNCNKVNRKVSYKYTKLLFEWLESEGLAVVHTGEVSEWKCDEGVWMAEKASRSSLELSLELTGLIVPPKSKKPLEKLVDVLEVRDCEGNKITKRLTDKERHLIEVLNTYNTLANEIKLEANGKRYWVQAKKIFNQGSFNIGGRTYLTGDTDLLMNNIRQDIRIDDQPTVELDYKALHPSLIAEWEGVKWDDGFDPYDIGMHGYDKKCLRGIAKVALLCSLNANSHNTARKALNFHLMKKVDVSQWKRNKLVPPVIDSTGILEVLRNHNPYLKDWLYSGKGGVLQNTDSMMMDYILDAFQQKGNLIVPIHDGLVLQKGFTSWGKGIMMDAYQEVMGSNFNCKVEEK